MISIPRSSNLTWARPLVGAVGSALLGLIATTVLAAPPSTLPVRPGELLAGFLPVTEKTASRWCWSGAWLYPIGDPHALGLPAPDGDPGYAVNRGIGQQEDGSFHQGADLCNRRRGGLVHAAAGGIVVRTALQITNGYGIHVVIAHREPNSPLVYSLYAHLLPGSVRVAAGEIVSAGQPIARVGRSGRASTDHLHFEIRTPSDPSARWELATPIDPVEFVTERLASERDTAWDAPYLEWAECAGIVGADTRGDDRLRRRDWWAMIARSARPSHAASASGVSNPAAIVADMDRDPDDPIGWTEMAGDLGRLETAGVRLPRCLVTAEVHRRTCRAQLDRERPSRKPKRLAAARYPNPPTVSDACLVLADLVVRTPRGNATPRRSTRPKPPAQHVQPDSSASATR